MKFYVFFLIVILLCFFSCDSSFDFEPSFEEDQLVLNGYISPQSMVLISLSTSRASTDRVIFKDSSHIIKNAQILLFEDDIIIDTLIYSTMGKYVPSKIYEITEGVEYYVTASAEGYDNVESEILRIPKPITITNIEYDSLAIPSESISVTLLNDESDENFYLFKLDVGNNEGIYNGGAFYPEMLSEHNISVIEKSHSTLILVSQKLFIDEIKIIFSFKKDHFIGATDIVFDGTKVRVWVSSLNEKYKDVFDNNYDGFGSLFFSNTKLSYSNIKGGYGVILPVNEEIQLKYFN